MSPILSWAASFSSLHLCLGHLRARAAILLFELIGCEVALGRLVSSSGSNSDWKTCIAYGCIDTDLAACDINTSEPDGAGLSREGRYEERAERHFGRSQRGVAKRLRGRRSRAATVRS